MLVLKPQRNLGLSYSSFKYSVASAPAAPVSLAGAQALVDELSTANRTFLARASVEAADALHKASESSTLANYSVTVTNSGSVDADDVILGFLVPPNAGKDGVPLQTLFGFERVHLKAGETKTVYVYPSLQDFTQVDTEGKRYVHVGEYTVRFGEARSGALGMGFAEHSLQTSL